MEAIVHILPEEIANIVANCSEPLKKNMEEMRLRIGRPLEVIAFNQAYYPKKNGSPYIVSKEDALHMLTQLSEYSLYAFEEELRQGYITIQGGHRVGLAGRALVENGKIKTLRHISSFNIRFAKQAIGCADQLVSKLYHRRWKNTLIIGPPQSGKTTLLRDLARIISSGATEKNIPPLKVGIVDERSEIAACFHGIPQHQFGYRIDVLDRCPKAEGMMMMIRSMSPDVIVVDELGSEKDALAFMEAIHAGVVVVTTVHGNSLEDIAFRPAFQTLLQLQALECCIELEAGKIKRIRDLVKKTVVSER